MKKSSCEAVSARIDMRLVPRHQLLHPLTLLQGGYMAHRGADDQLIAIHPLVERSFKMR